MRKKGEKIKEGEKTERQNFSAGGDGLSERERERDTLWKKREGESVQTSVTVEQVY